MNLINDEKIVREEYDGALTLSTHRVRYETKRPGEANFTSIMLDQICSCAIRYKSYPILIVLGVISLLAGAYFNRFGRQSSAIIIGAVIGLLLFLFYWGTRKQVISIASAAASINFEMSKIGLEKGKELVDAVEQAKDARYLKLNKC